MAPPRHVLGISAFYHDAAAALLREGRIVAAAQEERFTRIKNEPEFPRHAIDFCLRYGKLDAGELDCVVFYDKPVLKFTRLLETYLAVAPGGWRTFPEVFSNWLGGKLDLRKTIRAELPGLRADCPVLFTAHHQAHAASAFYPSPFENAAILTIDAVGEWATTTIGRGRGNSLELLKELRFPHSPGMLYSAFTDYCGFRINSGEYKLMGLAPYGKPVYTDVILRELLDLKEDGSFWMNLDFFNFLRGTTMTNARFHQLFGGPPRRPEEPMEQRHMDVARSIQAVTEEIVLRLARHARELTGEKNLCMAGGVALNCVANGRLLRERIFDRIWIQPAANDAGGALGAAFAAWHAGLDGTTPATRKTDAMQGSLLGPEFTDEEIEAALRGHGAKFKRLSETELLDTTVNLLQAGKVIGWVQGRMEFGPRALGNRSILGDARSPKMQSVMNLKVKFRESFRPFAPIVNREKAAEYFDLTDESPYMLLVANVLPSLRLPVPDGVTGLELLKQPRSQLPAVTHVDYSARIQTVARQDNPLLHELLARFERATQCGVLVNTSFNVRGEPIVCSPEDAYRCFVHTEMDYLMLGNFMLDRTEQPARSAGPARRPAIGLGMKLKLKEDPREWRKAAWMAALGLAVLGCVLRWRHVLPPVILGVWLGLLAAVAVAAALRPRWFRGHYRFGARLGFGISKVVGMILLGILFFAVVTPLGLIMRLLGKDPLRLRRPVSAKSFWADAAPGTPLDRLF